MQKTQRCPKFLRHLEINRIPNKNVYFFEDFHTIFHFEFHVLISSNLIMCVDLLGAGALHFFAELQGHWGGPLYSRRGIYDREAFVFWRGKIFFGGLFTTDNSKLYEYQKTAQRENEIKPTQCRNGTTTVIFIPLVPPCCLSISVSVWNIFFPLEVNNCIKVCFVWVRRIIKKNCGIFVCNIQTNKYPSPLTDLTLFFSGAPKRAIRKGSFKPVF